MVAIRPPGRVGWRIAVSRTAPSGPKRPLLAATKTEDARLLRLLLVALLGLAGCHPPTSTPLSASSPSALGDEARRLTASQPDANDQNPIRIRRTSGLSS